MLIECDLTILAAGGEEIPFEGWVDLDVTVGTYEAGLILRVPFLVTQQAAGDQPILGYNVIKCEGQGVREEVFVQCLQSAMGCVSNSDVAKWHKCCWRIGEI